MGRHLHESGMDVTCCGLQLGHPLGGYLASDMRRSVHVTKARKSDCEKCRKAYRAHVAAVRPVKKALTHA